MSAVLTPVVKVESAGSAVLHDRLAEGVFDDPLFHVVIELPVHDIPGAVVDQAGEIGLRRFSVQVERGAVLDVSLPEIVTMFALKPLGSISVVLIDLHHARGVSGTGEGVLQRGPFQFAFLHHTFHLQDMDDGGNASGRLFPPQQDRRVKDFLTDLELQSGAPAIWLQPVKPLLVVRGEIPFEGADGYTGTLADVFLETRKRSAAGIGLQQRRNHPEPFLRNLVCVLPVLHICHQKAPPCSG